MSESKNKKETKKEVFINISHKEFVDGEVQKTLSTGKQYSIQLTRPVFYISR